MRKRLTRVHLCCQQYRARNMLKQRVLWPCVFVLCYGHDGIRLEPTWEAAAEPDQLTAKTKRFPVFSAGWRPRGERS